MPRIVQWERLIGRRLQLRDLFVFFTVVSCGSMAKAAAQLGVSTPSISEIIAALEHALGVRLLDRSHRGVHTTPSGQALLRRGHAAFDELRQGIRDIELLGDPNSGEVRIACQGTFAATILPLVVERFIQRYPHVVVHHYELTSLAAQLSELRDRKYDFIMARMVGPLEGDDLNVDVLFNDRMVLIAGMQTRWARRRKIDLAELVDQPWILSAPDTWNYARLAEAFQARGLPCRRQVW